MKKLESLTSADVVAQNIETLKQLFPTIVKEGQIDVEELKALLTDEAVVSGDEYYRFTWAGKAEARAEANKASTATLRPDKESSKDWDTTGNIFIEGDNLEVLKLLQKSYSNKIKMIYIDPPYNTGKDILYKNNFSDGLKSYLSLTKQISVEGFPLFTNTESDGRFHSNWLSLMYPRVFLSRNLLTNDGVFIISIDHYELHNLIIICNEVFGEENKLGILAVVHKPEGRNQSKFFGESHEYMLFYAKNKVDCSFNKVVLDEDKKKEFNEADDIGLFKRKNFIRLSDGKYSLRENKPDFYYPIYVSPDLKEMSINEKSNYVAVYPITQSGQERTWKTSRETAEDRILDETLFCVKENGSIAVYEKLREDQVIKTHWIDKKYHAYHFGTKLVDTLLEAKTFDFPKSLPLIIDVLKLIVDSDSLILDFFSGSGTTAHAVMQLNAEDGGTRKCISVQLPEPTDEKSEAYKAGYSVISDITKERIRRAGEKIKADNKDKEGIKKLDVGFKAFKLDSSNVRAWDSSKEALQQQLDLFVENNGENIKADRTEEDILFEVLLKYGLDLSIKIEKREVANTPVYNIGYGSLFICLANKITTAVSEGIGAWKEELEPAACRVIFKDTGFGSDADKTNSMQILKRFLITEVATI